MFEYDIIPLAFGVPGPRELLLVACVALALYGRSGLLKSSRPGRALAPWVEMTRHRSRAAGRGPGPRAPASSRGGRWFWAFALVAAVAVGSWVVTRLLILEPSGLGADPAGPVHASPRP